MATKKAVSKSTQKGGLPAAPTGDWRNLIKSSTAAALTKGVTPGGGGFLSFGEGSIEYGKQSLGHDMDVIIIGVQAERAYYDTPFKAGKLSSPACYSYDGEQPHPAAARKQCDDCLNCPLNEFGSAREGGGKACKEGYKLALIDAKAVKSGTLETAEIVQARFSVLNSKEVARHIATLQRRFDHTLVVSHLNVQADKKSKYRVTLEVVDQLSEEDLELAGSRVQAAQELLNNPYPTFDDAPEKKPSSGGIRRRKY